jgi:3-deoxy-manno-octulosonate cytidylyltransferase (CMP-KDO synthetase)
MEKVLAVIPARYGSTRLRAKALAPIGGMPMVCRVYESAVESGVFDEVLVATDDARIQDAVERVGGRAVMTRAGHPSGTDRVAEAAASESADIVLNLQGDLPFVTSGLVGPVVAHLRSTPTTPMATVAVPLRSRERWLDPNVVKVVTDEQGFALYFSRAPIPARRGESAEETFGDQHVGVYGYRRDFLFQFTSWAPSTLERLEGLEQLRALERGARIFVARVDEAVVEVDTAEDLERAERHAAAEWRGARKRRVGGP